MVYLEDRLWHIDLRHPTGDFSSSAPGVYRPRLYPHERRQVPAVRILGGAAIYRRRRFCYYRAAARIRVLHDQRPSQPPTSPKQLGMWPSFCASSPTYRWIEYYGLTLMLLFVSVVFEIPLCSPCSLCWHCLGWRPVAMPESLHYPLFCHWCLFWTPGDLVAGQLAMRSPDRSLQPQHHHRLSVQKRMANDR